ncbi:allantoinase AllB [Bacteroidota bacterium]
MKRCLKNVFISAGVNNLKLVDIHFDDKIIEVIDHLNNTIPWEKINTKKDLANFISQLPQKDFEATENVIDDSFILAMPGGIDAHVHFNTPGFEQREDFEHGSLAAAYGGVTTIIDMPCTSIPPITCLKNLQTKLAALQNKSIIDYAFWGGVAGNDFENGNDIENQIIELNEAGVVGFKTYILSGMDTFTDLTEQQLIETATMIKSINGIMAVHAEDKDYVESRYNKFIRENRNDWRAYCKSRSVEAETVAVKKIVNICELTGCRIHIVHLSSAEALKHIREAQQNGINISTETCPHFLRFTQKDFGNSEISAFLKTAPPVKFEEDREALWEGLKDGTISFVTTDHAGCNPEKEKTSNNFWEVYGGIPGVEHRIPFIFSEGLFKRNLTIAQIIGLLTINAAEFFNLNSKGSLEKGKDADITLIDLWSENFIDSATMHSKGKYTPFHGDKLNVNVKKTILRGKVIIDSEKTYENNYGFGQFVKANR